MIDDTYDEEGIRLKATDEWIHRHEFTRPRDKELVRIIERRIEEESHLESLYTLRLFLARELRLKHRHSESRAVYMRLHDDFPDRPQPLISLASQKLCEEDDPEVALGVIDRAIDVAFRSGDFRRYALGEKARIALALKRYDLVEEVMRLILPLKTAPGHFDCGIERDFLDRLPPGVIDETVRNQYVKLRREYEAKPLPPRRPSSSWSS